MKYTYALHVRSADSPATVGIIPVPGTLKVIFKTLTSLYFDSFGKVIDKSQYLDVKAVKNTKKD